MFDLIKANIDEMVETDEDNKLIIKNKIKSIVILIIDISMLLQKYVRNIENIEDYKSNGIDLEYNEEFIKNLMGKGDSGEWVLITLNNNNIK